MFDGCTIHELNDKEAEIVNAEGVVLAVIKDHAKFKEACYNASKALDHYHKFLLAFTDLLISVKKSLDEAQDNLGKIDVNKLDDVNTMRVSFAQSALNDIFKAFTGLIPLSSSFVKDNEEFI